MNKLWKYFGIGVAAVGLLITMYFRATAAPVPAVPVMVSNNAVKPVITTWDYQLSNAPGDPAGINGLMHYNTTTDKFRCYQGGAWTNCIGTGGSGSPGGANTQLQYNNAGNFGGIAALTWSGTVLQNTATTTLATTTISQLSLGNGLVSSFLAVDQNGKVIATTTPAGSLSGGTNGYLARWTSASTLSSGLLLDDGTVSGVNATSSTVTFFLQGSSNVMPFAVASSTGAILLEIHRNGAVSIGTTTNTSTLTVQGTSTLPTLTLLTIASSSGSSYLSVSNTGVTTINSLTLTSPLTVANGGTGASTAAGARNNLNIATSTITFWLNFSNGVASTTLPGLDSSSTLISWTAINLAETSCTASVDIWKKNNTFPTSANTIISGTLPGLSSQASSTSSSLSGWTTNFLINDYLHASSTSANCGNIAFKLTVQR